MNLWDWLVHFGDHVTTVVKNAASSPWAYFWIFVVSMVDGFFPVVPSETIVIGMATIASQDGKPWLAGVWLAAAAGAWCGDQIAYILGTKIHIRNLRMFRSQRGQRTLDWAEHALIHRGAAFIIAARFIPFGRIAVNLTAGALGYNRKRFMIIDAIAVSIWATYGVALGVTASSFGGNLLVSVAIGVVAGVVLGWVIDKILGKFGVTVPEADADKPRAADAS